MVGRLAHVRQTAGIERELDQTTDAAALGASTQATSVVSDVPDMGEGGVRAGAAKDARRNVMRDEEVVDLCV